MLLETYGHLNPIHQKSRVKRDFAPSQAISETRFQRSKRVIRAGNEPNSLEAQNHQLSH
jgi:hypothetical protein